MSDRSHYITPEGFRRLQAELDELWRVERPRVTNEVSVAAAHGDRSDDVTDAEPDHVAAPQLGNKQL